MVQRSDYVFNANDSFWVPNGEVTLSGSYSLLHGEQNAPLSMRTRQNAAVLEREQRHRAWPVATDCSTPTRCARLRSTTAVGPQYSCALPR